MEHPDREPHVIRPYYSYLDEALSHAFQDPGFVLRLPDGTRFTRFRDAMLHVLASANGATADVCRGLRDAGHPYVVPEIGDEAAWRNCYADCLASPQSPL